MSIRKSVYEWLDKRVAGPIPVEKIDHERNEAHFYHCIKSIQEMNTEFVALDTKASALIAHVSLMIAAISVLHGEIDSRWLKTVFLLEMIYYVITLILVLRVVYYQLYSDIVPVSQIATDEYRSDSSMKELLTRGTYYQRAHFMTIIGTVILVLSLIAALLVGGDSKS